VYHLTDGETLTARDLFCAFAEALGVPAPRFSLPFPAAYSLAVMMEWLARLRKETTPPALTRYGIRLVASDSRYDIAKARKELGYEPPLTFSQGVKTLLPASG
jgi:nucleoside-diphosphate-sugar epimerase